MKERIYNLIQKSLFRLSQKKLIKTSGFSEINIEKPKNPEFGDYSTNIALILAKKESKKSRELAETISKELSEFNDGVFDEISVAGPGFINFKFKKAFISSLLKEVILLNGKFGRKAQAKKQKVLLEFVSANPTGPLHVGHGRWAVMGDALANILKETGFKVDKEFYVNDIGRQINLLTQSVVARAENRPLPEDGYGGDYVNELAVIFKKSINDKNLPRKIIEHVLDEQKRVLKKLGVKFDKWFFESSLYKKNKIKKIIDILKIKKAVFQEKGAFWFKSEYYGDDKNRVLIREDGNPTYFASDIAYHADKFERKYDKLINIWGTDHHGYVSRLKAAMTCLGKPVETLIILIGQLVSLFREGVPVRMSKRSGEMVTLEEVVDEIGKDATRFFFLMTSADSHLDFDLSLAKKHSSDNPVYYVQYAHARISSILREAEKRKINIKKTVKSADFSLLTESEELDLIKKIMMYPDELNDSANALLTNRLINYSREIAAMFHNFYHKHRVISDNVELTNARISLVFATRIVLKNVLILLGISAPEKM